MKVDDVRCETAAREMIDVVIFPTIEVAGKIKARERKDQALLKMCCVRWNERLKKNGRRPSFFSDAVVVCVVCVRREGTTRRMKNN